MDKLRGCGWELTELGDREEEERLQVSSSSLRCRRRSHQWCWAECMHLHVSTCVSHGVECGCWSQPHPLRAAPWDGSMGPGCSCPAGLHCECARKPRCMDRRTHIQVDVGITSMCTGIVTMPAWIQTCTHLWAPSTHRFTCVNRSINDKNNQHLLGA